LVIEAEHGNSVQNAAGGIFLAWAERIQRLAERQFHAAAVFG